MAEASTGITHSTERRKSQSRVVVERTAPGHWGVLSSYLEVLWAKTDETPLKGVVHLKTNRKVPTTQSLVS